MTFADLAAGEPIFIDANSFVYHFAPDPLLGSACSELIQRIDNQEIPGFTSTHILTEVAHRLMTIEASALFGWPFTGIAYRLNKHPCEVQKLTASRRSLESVLNSRIQVTTIAPALVVAATAVSEQTGLLTNDALVVAVMQSQGLTRLASNDADFDRVPGLIRYAPA
jgi:predicted nucleic acid-binding protein